MACSKDLGNIGKMRDGFCEVATLRRVYFAFGPPSALDSLPTPAAFFVVGVVSSTLTLICVQVPAFVGKFTVPVLFIVLTNLSL